MMQSGMQQLVSTIVLCSFGCESFCTDTTDADGPVPVPQSDFEIEINSTNQDGPTSPGHEITLTSTVSTMPMEPRVSHFLQLPAVKLNGNKGNASTIVICTYQPQLDFTSVFVNSNHINFSH